MSGGVRFALKVSAAALLPTVGGLVLLGWAANKLGEWYAQGHDALEAAVQDELESWFPRAAP